MKPTNFGSANGTLSGGPAATYGTAGDVIDLPVFRDGTLIMSCWRPSFRERLRLLFGGRVWLRILTRNTHPPVSVEV